MRDFMEYQLWLAPWHSFNFGIGLGASSINQSINQSIFIYMLYQYKLKNRLVHITVFFRGGHVICCALRRWCPRQSCLGSNWPLCHNWIILHGNQLMSYKNYTIASLSVLLYITICLKGFRIRRGGLPHSDQKCWSWLCFSLGQDWRDHRSLYWYSFSYLVYVLLYFIKM